MFTKKGPNGAGKTTLLDLLAGTSRYLVIVGGLAVAATPVTSRGPWGLASKRFGWSLLPDQP